MRLQYALFLVVCALLLEPVFAAPKAKSNPKPMDIPAAISQMREFNMQFSENKTSSGRPDPQMVKRNNIMKVLRAGNAKSVEALAKALKDPNVQMRRNASIVLGELAGVFGNAKEDIRVAIPALTEAVNDSDFSVRVWAMGALGAVGPDAKDAIPALETAAKDKDKSVQVNAEKALKSIKSEK